MEVEAISLILLTLMVLVILIAVIFVTIFGLIYLARIDESTHDMDQELSNLSHQVNEIRRTSNDIKFMIESYQKMIGSMDIPAPVSGPSGIQVCFE